MGGACLMALRSVESNTLKDIQFPVYRLGKDKPQREGDVLFYLRCYDGEDSVLIVDDKSWHHETLGQRRLKIMMSSEAKLFKLDHTIFFIADLIKLATPSTWFIDDLGAIFIYTKSGKAKLLIKPIKQVIPTTSGVIIEVEGIQTRFKCLYAPKFEKFAGLLKIGHMYILYGMYEDPPKDTWRMV